MKEFNLEDMLLGLQEDIRKSAVSPNINAYKPHPKQIEFHKGSQKGKLYIGGNRAGKTVGGATEAIWWLTKKHPYRRLPEGPIRGRCLSVDFTNGVESIVKPEIKRWLPLSELKNGSWEDSYNSNTRTLTLENGSFLEFKSYDQELDKMAGTSRHFMWFDEEPPKSIFTECYMRLLDTNGSYWITMTPVDGFTWVAEDLYEPGLLGLKDIQVLEIDTTENPHLSPESIAEFMGNLDEDEKKARKEGKFVLQTGLIFPMFDPTKHIVSGPVSQFFNMRDPNIRLYASMDHGLDNPTAWLWHAIRNDGSVVTFHELYLTNTLISDFAMHIKKIEVAMGRTPELRIGDPSIKQRNGQTGLSNQIAYSQQGIFIALAPGGKDSVNPGIEKMREYMVSGKWVIHESCHNLIRELRRYRWKPWESRKVADKNNKKDEPLKKNDHAIDSVRYMFSFLPDLSRKKEDPDMKLINAQIAANLGAKRAVDMRFGRLDPNFDPIERNEPKKTTWVGVDETLGGIW